MHQNSSEKQEFAPSESKLLIDLYSEENPLLSFPLFSRQISLIVEEPLDPLPPFDPSELSYPSVSSNAANNEMALPESQSEVISQPKPVNDFYGRRIPLPARNINEPLQYVFYKQYNRILKLREKRAKLGIQVGLKIRSKRLPRVRHAEKRDRLPNGRFAPRMKEIHHPQPSWLPEEV